MSTVRSSTADKKWWGWRGGATALEMEPTGQMEETAAAARRLPAVEREYVQGFYNAAAAQWKGSRQPAWPCVRRFVASLPRHTLLCDAGCGDGKNLSLGATCGTGQEGAPCGGARDDDDDAARNGDDDAMTTATGSGWVIGADNSVELAKICAGEGLEAAAADALCLPYRDGCFDACLSVAVLHHISSPARRRVLVRECGRVLRVGGRALVCAWAREQRGTERGGGAGKYAKTFGAADVMVPWTATGRRTQFVASSSSSSSSSSSAAVAAAPPEDETNAGAAARTDLLRYCHVFEEGEVAALVAELNAERGAAGPWLRVDEDFYAEGHWCLAFTKTADHPAAH